MPSKSSPIGIFDSGIGGLTIAAAIRKALPSERLLYFGDTAHFPYGDKSAAAIKHYAIRITSFLLAQDCKAIVIACNTASAHATAETTHTAGEHVPVFNVIDPIAAHIAEKWPKSSIGVIGTKGTIGSRVYKKAINKLAPAAKVRSLATPLLAPMIEEGFYNNKISHTIIANYLSHRNLKDIEALVLGCTHYPLIKGEVKEVLGDKVTVLDPPTVVAAHVRKSLEERGLLAPSNDAPKHRFHLSDATPSFAKSATRFFKQKVTVKELRLWDQ